LATSWGITEYVVIGATLEKNSPSFQEALLYVTEIHSSHIISFIAAMMIAFIPHISFVYI